MTSREQLIDRHIREYESRLKRVDELYVRADEVTRHLDEQDDTRSKLKNYAKLRRQLAKKTDDVKTMPAHEWREETIQNAGPMAIWDVLAQQLESLIEKHEN